MTAGLGPGEVAVLVAATFVAGLVRGFAGFGTGLVYLPVAGMVLTPFQAFTTVVVFDLLGPLPNVRRAVREGEPADIAQLAAGLVVALPLGLYTLTVAPPELFRYAVSVTALAMLGALGAGLRYRGRLTPGLVVATGALAGFLLGVAGLPGPPVVLLYMASTRPASVVRANTLVFLLLCDLAMLPALAAFGRLDGGAALLGALLILPNLAGNVAGAWLFRPGRERLYRRVACAIIAAAAVTGLPLWD